MFVGSSGTGKSVIITNRLEKFNPQNFLISTLSLNCIISIRIHLLMYFEFPRLHNK
jgi:hypothetical protein